MDHYETLQISANAEPETIHRVYRLLAQRFHPDNAETGNADRFRQLAEAYEVLSDPERRAQYDVVHQQFWRERWKVVESTGADGADFRAGAFRGAPSGLTPGPTTFPVSWPVAGRRFGLRAESTRF